MSAGTHIERTEATWNPVTGCTRVSSGCDHCYAAAMTHRIGSMGRSLRLSSAQRAHAERYIGLTVENAKGDRHFNGKVRCHEDLLELPLHWKKPRRVFVNSMSDLFHKDVPFEFITEVFTTMGMCAQHTFQILTKRPERLAEFFDWNYPSAMMSREAAAADWVGSWPNVWLGTSCEDQETLDERLPHLLNTAAAVRFLSLEPLLGPIDLRFGIVMDGVRHRVATPAEIGIHWVIVGGESGPGARPMHPDWVRSIRDQCAVPGVPFFFKQWGEWWPGEKGRLYREQSIDWSDGQQMVRVGKKAAGAVLDGREWREYPDKQEDLT